MASGDTVFQGNASPVSGSWSSSTTPGPTIGFDLRNAATGLDIGDMTLTARPDAPPYGQGWTDSRSPFTPGKTYILVITEA